MQGREGKVCGRRTPPFYGTLLGVLGWSHENALNNTMDTFVSKTLRASHSSYASWADLHNTYSQVYIAYICRVYIVCSVCYVLQSINYTCCVKLKSLSIYFYALLSTVCQVSQKEEREKEIERGGGGGSGYFALGLGSISVFTQRFFK